ncbi:hypothetical protein [Nitrincola sp. A-D6]|uniref:hypothetical protein n=1 Tax=Nitrincola sp. A-D6 TaxID=1545442 RepID=UPI001185638C|nr:hypothetical protein [Nitrincola sp. A-D6]
MEKFALGNILINFYQKFRRVIFIFIFSTYSLIISYPAASSIQHEQAQASVNARPSNEMQKFYDVITELENTIQLQSEVIEELKMTLDARKTSQKNEMSFEVWAGLLLASSALLLTIIGIGIALLSVFGYRKLVKKSKDVAEKISIKVARETSKATANEATAAELVRLLEAGNFDKVIREAIESISLRGVSRLDELE